MNKMNGTVRVAAWVVGFHVAVIVSLLAFKGCGMVQPRRPHGEEVQVVLPPPGPSEAIAVQRPVVPPLGPLPPAVGANQWPGRTKTYEVKPGDTLGGIASQHGLSVNQIMELNPSITNPNRIRAKQKIVLPATAGTTRVATGRTVPQAPERAAPARVAPARAAPAAAATRTPLQPGETIYKVKSGDMLSVIAANHRITTRELMTRNALTSDRLAVNDELIIPATATPPTPPPPAAVADIPAIDAGLRLPAAIDEAPRRPTTPTPGATPAATTPAAAATPPVVGASAVPPPPAAAPGGATRAPPSVTIHTVEPGEDIFKISMMWQADINRIREMNNLPREAQLKVGQQLRIPLD